MSHLLNTIKFLTSAASLSQLPSDSGAEVAFVGRSNVGKSSALNAITGTKKLAKVSNTPGRTQLINLFTLDEKDEKRRLVDLPGYGYAKVSTAIKQRWQKNLAAYLETRDSLKGVILLMDCRHPLTELDKNFLCWGAEKGLAIHVLLTKADKLSKSQAQQAFRKVTTRITDYHPFATVQLFSATHKMGLAEIKARIATWLLSC